MATNSPVNQQSNKLSMNRTGLQMSPQDSRRLLEAADEAAPIDPRALAVVREQYIADADPLGSVPLPGSMKGMIKAGARMITGKHPEVLIDKLAERLAFERGGTRLYDALISKFDALAKPAPAVSRERLLQIRDEEAEHFHLLSETLRELGADPTAQTPSADLVGVESFGLMQAVSDPRTSFSDSLHAILIAELADNEAWNTLITLAETAGEEELVSRFRKAQEEEAEHLQTIRTWYQQLILEPVD